MRQPPYRPEERQAIPGLLRLTLIQRLISLPRWALILGAVLAVPAFVSPVAGLARYTTGGSDFCVSCHGTGETPDRALRSLVHPNNEQVTCVDCHAKTGQIVFEGYVQGFMAEPERVSANCVRCHQSASKSDDQAGFQYNFMNIRITHRSHLERGATCTTCHANVAHDLAVPQTNRPRMEACNTCHAANDGGGAVSGAGGGCAKCHSQGLPAPVSVLPAAGSNGSWTDGRAYYLRTCSACHGAKGDGIAKVNLARQDTLERLGEDKIILGAKVGHGKMPGFGIKHGGTLNDEQIRAILGYLLSEALSDRPPDGRVLYDRACIVCHGVNGDLVAGVQLSAASFWQKFGDAELLAAVSRGIGGMPPLGKSEGGHLSNQEISAVIGYLKEKAGFSPAANGPNGAALYAQNCASCHGADGKQLPKANLANKEFIGSLGDEKLTASIADGKGGMPAYGAAKGGKLSAPEIAALVQFVRGLAGLPAANGAKPAGPDGAALFKQSCAACHGADGKQLPSANLASKEFIGARADAKLAAAIADGAGGMPGMGQAKGGKLSAADVAALVQHMKKLAGVAGAPAAAPAAPASPGTAPAAAPAAPGAATVPPATAGAGATPVLDGAALYKQSCAACHGATGGQLPSANLGSAAFLKERGDLALAKATAEGKGGMPALGKAKGGTLSDQQVGAIIEHLKSAAR